MLLITGAYGQLGTALKEAGANALFADADTLDITNAEAVKRFVGENDIDAIVNCAAYTAVDMAEDERDLCRKINVDGVKNLAQSGAETVVHISTDYVFDGKNCVPYTEADAPAPIGVYAQSKAESERAVMEYAPTGVVIRTGWMYGVHGTNFVKTMRRLGAERDTLNVVFDQVGTPTYADDLAAAAMRVLPRVQKGSHEIYHYANEGVCSWYDFAVEIMALSGLKCKVNPIHSAEYPTKAARPHFSVLDKTKIKKAFNLEIPYWKESLIRCLKRF